MANPYTTAADRVARIRAEITAADTKAAAAEQELAEIAAFREGITATSPLKDVSRAEQLGTRAGLLAAELKDANRIRSSFRPELERAEQDLAALDQRVRDARRVFADLVHYEDRNVRELRQIVGDARAVLRWVGEEPGEIVIKL
jgi:hypothetical protein